MDELKNIAPELSKIERKNPFSVPDNYFEDFSARLQVRLDAQPVEKQGVKTRIIQYLKPALALAAGFALIFTLVYWPVKLITPGEVAGNNSSEQGISDMVYRNMVEGIDEYSFVALLDENPNEVKFSDDELVTYLNTNSSDYEVLAQIQN